MAGVSNGDTAVVSDRTVQVGNTSYDYADIATVSLVRPILLPLYGWVLAAVGLIVLLAGYFVWGVFLTPMLAGAVMLVAGVIIALMVRETYTVRLNPRSGEPVLLQFKDGAAAQRTVTKIGAALDQQRAPTEKVISREVGQ